MLYNNKARRATTFHTALSRRSEASRLGSQDLFVITKTIWYHGGRDMLYIIMQGVEGTLMYTFGEEGEFYSETWVATFDFL